MPKLDAISNLSRTLGTTIFTPLLYLYVFLHRRSFGVVLSELFTRGTAPYADVYDNKELTRKIRSGWRMPRPPLVMLTSMADVLASCHARPSL
jgi:hypothetical protein